MAREMGSPRHVDNRRRRTREGPEPACVHTVFAPGCASKLDGESREEPEEHKRKQGRRAQKFISSH